MRCCGDGRVNESKDVLQPDDLLAKGSESEHATTKVRDCTVAITEQQLNQLAILLTHEKIFLLTVNYVPGLCG